MEGKWDFLAFEVGEEEEEEEEEEEGEEKLFSTEQKVN